MLLETRFYNGAFVESVNNYLTIDPENFIHPIYQAMYVIMHELGSSCQFNIVFTYEEMYAIRNSSQYERLIRYAGAEYVPDAMLLTRIFGHPCYVGEA